MTEVTQAPSLSTEIDAGLGGVVLRLTVPEDGKAIRRLVNHNTEHFLDVGEDMPDYCATDYAIKLWIDGNTDEDAQFPTSKYSIWSKGELVGCTGVMDVEDMSPQLWIWIGAQKTRRGNAAAAIKTMVWELFGIGVPQIDAWIRDGNEASRMAFLSLGFKVGKRTVRNSGYFTQYYAQYHSFDLSAARPHL